VGQIRGSNLFHSFGQFNLFRGESATFTGPNTITNILSRVTGGNSSNIDGTIKSNIRGANLFLLNPSGVIFGPNASLEVSGSFHVSTATALRFSDGATFSANLRNTSTLTCAPPVAFGFLHSNPAGITIEGSQLAVNTGAALSVTGGDITLRANQEGAIQGPALRAPSGRIYLTSVASAGDVQIEASDTPSRLMTNRPQGLGSIGIRDGALVFASGTRGGTILVEASTVRLADRATLRNDTSGAGQSGDIVLTANDLTVRGGSSIIASTTGAGRGGNVTLVADALIMDGVNSRIVTATQRGTGNAGDIRVEAQTVTVTNGAQIGSGVFSPAGQGQGGNVTVLAQDAVTLDGFGEVVTGGQKTSLPSVISTANQPGTTGAAGHVRVEARTVTVTRGAQIQSGVIGGQGQGGDLTVRAQDAVTLDGFGGGLLSLISANSQPQPVPGAPAPGGIGDAGNVRVEARTVTATNGAQISSITFGPGKGGSVTVMARDSVTFRGTSPQGEGLLGVLFPGESTFASGASVASVGSGPPGKVQVTAPRVTLAEGGGISALTVASLAAGGTVIVQASDTLAIAGTGSNISTASSGPGAGGNIALHARAIMVTAGARITAASTGAGDAGQVTLTAPTVELDGGTISAESTGLGNAGNIILTLSDSLLSTHGSLVTRATRADGGNIQITAPQMIRLRDSKITAAVGGGPETVGGNITIDPQFVVLQNSQIVATAFQGQGGRIDIQAQQAFLADPASLVSAAASSKLGINGQVDIRAPVKSISGILAPLPQAFASAAALLRSPCAARLHEGTVSTLVERGRDGVPAAPDGVLPSRLPLAPLDTATPPHDGGLPSAALVWPLGES
jgi:filamentous hemagglutinin family protein